MKKIYKIVCLTFFAILCIAGDVRASHMMGSDVSYECISPGKYKITLKAYRDCRGIPISGSPLANVFCGSTSYPLAGAGGGLSRTSIRDITPICTNSTNPCGPPNSGNQQEG